MNDHLGFTRVTTDEQFAKALEYVVSRLAQLSHELTGEVLPVDAVKLFAHYPEEHAFMKSCLTRYGPISTIGRATSVYVDTDLTIAGNHIKHVGVRVPDPYRLQVGCGDFLIPDARMFAEARRDVKNGYIRPFPDLPNDMYELWHPDFDVMGYLIF